MRPALYWTCWSPRTALLPNLLCSLPNPGNLHEFTAHAPCAVLDVLVPPYCPAAHWDCTYFQEADGNGASKPGDVTLLRVGSRKGGG